MHHFSHWQLAVPRTGLPASQFKGGKSCHWPSDLSCSVAAPKQVCRALSSGVDELLICSLPLQKYYATEWLKSSDSRWYNWSKTCNTHSQQTCHFSKVRTVSAVNFFNFQEPTIWSLTFRTGIQLSLSLSSAVTLKMGQGYQTGVNRLNPTLSYNHATITKQ